LGINEQLVRDAAGSYSKHGGSFLTEVQDALREKGLDLLLEGPGCDPGQVRQRGFVPLLRTAMKLKAIDVFRRHRAVATLEGIEEEPGANQHDHIVAAAPGPERVVTAQVDAERLLEALERVLFAPAAAAIRRSAAQKGYPSPTGEPLFRAWLDAKWDEARFGLQRSQRVLGEPFGASQPTVSRRIKEEFKPALKSRMLAVALEVLDPALRTREHLVVLLALGSGLRGFLLDE
jgi:hypothetical protein